MGHTQEPGEMSCSPCPLEPVSEFLRAKDFGNNTRGRQCLHDSSVDMSTRKRRKANHTAVETDADGQIANPIGMAPSSWAGQAEAFARREPVKAVASAVGAGFLLNLLPVRGILGALGAVAFVVARPTLLFLGLLKAWELCPRKEEETKD